jgi:phosphoribosylanthranilate isomerase
MRSTKIKICGLTCEEDVDIVNAALPDFAGMVLFFPKSRRNISLERAERLLRRLKMSGVAVTVSPTVEQVSEIAEAGFTLIQIHAEFDREILKLHCVESGKLRIIRAINSINEESLKEIEYFRDKDEVSMYLFDAAEPGSGKSFDWNSIPGKDELCKPFILAGGLKPETVTEAINRVRPFAVDVSSGVEKDELPSMEAVEAGESMKSRDKILSFIHNVDII